MEEGCGWRKSPTHGIGKVKRVGEKRRKKKGITKKKRKGRLCLVTSGEQGETAKP